MARDRFVYARRRVGDRSPASRHSRAQTRLALTRVKVRDTDQVEVTGQLVDKLTGDGIGGQSVVVTISSEAGS